jgi:hypothetical protein
MQYILTGGAKQPEMKLQSEPHVQIIHKWARTIAQGHSHLGQRLILKGINVIIQSKLFA